MNDHSNCTCYWPFRSFDSMLSPHALARLAPWVGKRGGGGRVGRLGIFLENRRCQIQNTLFENLESRVISLLVSLLYLALIRFENYFISEHCYLSTMS